ncbi:phosphatidylinositol 4-phosphate 5-kinase 2-like [Copidosoma floridanum]|uniref:phosphatidylinositol 4-phosphate 5-kinase 2-like n=1 Tax=Copidosoma floridanum TaxID=29053 RepID=UPI000C6F6105|nr:phosphatidylinositol 4-phosphate 5-kinase 2-like [Copidosoma floridanum]
MNKAKVKKSKPLVKTTSIKNGKGVFHFTNGDIYEGSYVVVNKDIYRQEYGIYQTSDGDKYQTVWDRDRVGSKVMISYDNEAEYRGEVNNEGKMSGRGTYKFPDGSSLSAVWQNNEPVAEQIFTDTLGHSWLGKLSANKQVLGNYFL